jgi:hypothetical protein
MNWDAVGAIAEIIGAVAVVATLLYLAVQIKQANRQDLLGSFQHMHDTVNSFCRMISESEHLAGIVSRGRESYDDLSDEDRMRFDHVHFHLLNIIESHLFQSRQAGTDAHYRDWAIQNLTEIAAAYFAFPGTKDFWKSAEPFFDADVRKLVNDSIAG